MTRLTSKYHTIFSLFLLFIVICGCCSRCCSRFSSSGGTTILCWLCLWKSCIWLNLSRSNCWLNSRRSCLCGRLDLLFVQYLNWGCGGHYFCWNNLFRLLLWYLFHLISWLFLLLIHEFVCIHFEHNLRLNIILL